MPDDPRRQAPVEEVLPDRGAPSDCPECGVQFPTRFALRKHEHQGCPAKGPA